MALGLAGVWKWGSRTRSVTQITVLVFSKFFSTSLLDIAGTFARRHPTEEN